MERPIIISIIALLAMIMGLLGIITGIGSAFISEADFLTLNVDVTYDAFRMAGYVALATGLVLLVVGFLLWTGQKVAWYIAVIVFLIEIVVAIYNIITTKNFVIAVNIAISALVLFYLFTPKVRAFYGVS